MVSRLLKMACTFNQVKNNKTLNKEREKKLPVLGVRWKAIAFNDIFLAIRSFRNLRCKKVVIL